MAQEFLVHGKTHVSLSRRSFRPPGFKIPTELLILVHFLIFLWCIFHFMWGLPLKNILRPNTFLLFYSSLTQFPFTALFWCLYIWHLDRRYTGICTMYCTYQRYVLDTVQDFLIKLGIEPLMHLLEISIFSINNDLVRLTKIMNNLIKDLKILMFKVIF